MDHGIFFLRNKKTPMTQAHIVIFHNIFTLNCITMLYIILAVPTRRSPCISFFFGIFVGRVLVFTVILKT